MALRGWSWDAAIGPAGVGDRPLLEALAAAIPDEAVEAAIEASGAREQRRRRLPTHLVVTLVVAMGLWANESLRHVLAEVVAGWPSSRRASGPGPGCCGSFSRRWPGRLRRPRRPGSSWAACA